MFPSSNAATGRRGRISPAWRRPPRSSRTRRGSGSRSCRASAAATVIEIAANTPGIAERYSVSRIRSRRRGQPRAGALRPRRGCRLRARDRTRAPTPRAGRARRASRRGPESGSRVLTQAPARAKPTCHTAPASPIAPVAAAVTRYPPDAIRIVLHALLLQPTPVRWRPSARRRLSAEPHRASLRLVSAGPQSSCEGPLRDSLDGRRACISELLQQVA
jgi:hypothetical protein